MTKHPAGTSQVLDADLEPFDDGDDHRAVHDAAVRWACDAFDLEAADADTHDAVARTGLPVRVLSAAWRVRNGRTAEGDQQYTVGRFRLTEGDHDWLLANDGAYVLVVHERYDQGIRPVHARLLLAGFVHRMADGVEGTYRWPWPEAFPLAGGIQ